MEKKFEGFVLVSDMDGTLLNSKKEISKENLEAIDYFRKEGGKFTVATGRMVPAVEAYLKDMVLDLPAIIHNGAKIYDYNNKKVIVEHPIEEDRKKLIIDIKRDYPKLGIEIFCDEIVYIYNKCELTKRYEQHKYNVVYNMPEEIWNKNWVKILIVGEEEELDVLEKNYRNYDNGNAFRSGAKFFDIVAKGITKGQALQELIKEYNLDKDKVIAVGDNMNDIEMLSVAKYGFFIKGGAKRAEEQAKLLAPSNDENPIKYIVEGIECEI